MKKNHILRILFAMAATVLPLAASATVFFNDSFSGGSTINSLTPVLPTENSTSYEVMSAKAWNPQPSITTGDLKFGIAATTSGAIEVQALFATNAVALTQVGDYIQLKVVFTNTAGLITANNTFLAFGLYNSGGSFPVAGGLNATATTSFSDHATDGVAGWQGYVGQMVYSGNNGHQILTRAAQTGSANNNQDLVTTGSSSQSYRNPSASTVGSRVASSLILTNGLTYTEVLTITLTDVNTLAITNQLYEGPDASGTALIEFGGVASGGNYLTSGFDGLAIGWRETANTATTIDISSIVVSGQVTVISTPPDITLQPVPVTVPDGGSGAFTVGAQGFNVSYQWKRFGTNLVDGGNISGANSDMLIISPASAADVASGANGYYVTVSGAGGYSTNSTTNSLTLRTAKNLVWSGPGADWDLATSANWTDAGSNPSVFNFGDAVTFNGSGPGGVTLTGKYLSASLVTVDGTTGYSFGGTGSFAGPGSLLFSGTFLEIDNANTYTGGTTISNEAAYLYLNNYNGLGTGPITLAKAGGLMEVVPTGSASLGIKSDINVADDFTIQFDGSGAFAGVVFGNLSGIPGKTLTLNPKDVSLTNRFRTYGANTVYDANLNLNGADTPTAIYNGTVLAPYNGTGSQIYNGVISGQGGLVQRGGGSTILNGQNTYAGGTTPTTGTIGFGADTIGNVTSGPIGTGPLFLAPELPNTTGSGTVLASGGARTIANPLQYPSATNNLTLIIGGTNNLTFSGPFTLNGNDGTGTQTNRILQVANTALTTFTGVISDGGQSFSLTKTGAGTLALNNTETYTGLTTVNGGTLLVNGQVGGVLVTSGTLGGSGTIAGAVTIQTNGVLNPGTSIGTLTFNSSLTVNGGIAVEVNKSVTPSNDVAVVSGALANGGMGTVTVSNLGPALVVGDRFQIFNKALQNGDAMNITGGGANVSWNNNLAVDGSISVASLAPPAPPVITSTVLSGGNLIFSGTNATGLAGGSYYVLSSTNLASPLSSWVRAATNTFGPGGSFSVTNAISAGVPQKFYLLQLP